MYPSLAQRIVKLMPPAFTPKTRLEKQIVGSLCPRASSSREARFSWLTAAALGGRQPPVGLAAHRLAFGGYVRYPGLT